MKLKDLLLVADCNYHVFFKSEIANISGLPYEEIQKEQLDNEKGALIPMDILIVFT